MHVLSGSPAVLGPMPGRPMTLRPPLSRGMPLQIKFCRKSPIDENSMNYIKVSPTLNRGKGGETRSNSLNLFIPNGETRFSTSGNISMNVSVN